LKGLPFLIGTTSYIIPADILTNVKKMAPLVDDIELILFESEKDSNLPSKAIIRELSKIKNDFKNTYTIHLPLDLKLGDPSSIIRQSSVDQIKRIFDLTQTLAPLAYECHLNQSDRVKSAPKYSKEKKSWYKNCFTSLSCLLSYCSNPEIFCIENLESYFIEELIPFLEHFPVSLCFDAAHIWGKKRNPVKILQEYTWRIGVIHIYGLKSQYHTSLGCINRNDVFSFLDELLHRNYAKILTIEVFKEDDFNLSLAIIRNWWKQRGCI
jgi:sugar phosphate isomerase/epimerase